MSSLKFDPTLLAGATVHKVGVVPTEVVARTSQYLLLQCTDLSGIPFRVIFPFAIASHPCPNDAEMLNELISGTAFFTLDEIYARRCGDPLSASQEENDDKTEDSHGLGDSPGCP